LVARRIAPRHAGLRILAEHTGTTAPLAVSNVSELCFETCVNVLGRGAPFAEKLNDDPLVVLHQLNEKP
jgi:hypothetical protein